MTKNLVARDAIRLEFAGFGESVDPGLPPRDSLYLDTGNAIGPGVIDHHQLAAYTGSTAGLVFRHPEQVSASVCDNRLPEEPFTIFLHPYPDFDCLVSAYLAIAILVEGKLPSSAAALSRYADHVDRGHSGFSQQHPFSLYSGYLLLMNDHGGGGPEGWRECMTGGLRATQFVDERFQAGNVPITEVDAFACGEVFRPRDRREVQNDLRRYRDKLKDAECACRILSLNFPGEFGGTKSVDTLLARKVQDVDDRDRCIYFKDWARSDLASSPSGRGFAALAVFAADLCDGDQKTDEGTGPPARQTSRRHRCILSVTPDSGVTLQGLGEMLEEAESQARIAKSGVDDRNIDPQSGIPRPARQGFSNNDPWYDGRGHNYTIVDAPRSGTVLSADRIEQIFVAFGSRGGGQPVLADLPSPADDSDTCRDGTRVAGGPSSLSRLSTLVDHWRGKENRESDPVQSPAVFISYSRTCTEWVEENVVHPLVISLGSPLVYFDKHHLNAGMGWLTELAEAVMHCRLFLPIYCPAYFRSDFCQWELQLALTRDPTGNKRIIAPIMMEPTLLPAYCRLIQASTFCDATIGPQIVALVHELLGKARSLSESHRGPSPIASQGKGPGQRR
jgi:TIR domain